MISTLPKPQHREPAAALSDCPHRSVAKDGRIFCAKILCGDNADQAAQMQFGNATVEGTLTAYYEDAALINKFLNETESVLSVTVDDPTGTNGYTFYMPRIKYNGANVPVANMQSRLIELPFVALKDDTAGYSLRLTRTS